ncbi:putative eggshell protein [Armadillidium nasatum]|uniref:Putative eggshell protein n=1 Tax=Armadillidium nasatum TaxID=96803 RepID=A0A5N5TEZ4_9CRUS|nr:putative eggshell protein [Armadillidium nasatum]
MYLEKEGPLPLLRFRSQKKRIEGHCIEYSDVLRELRGRVTLDMWKLSRKSFTFRPFCFQWKKIIILYVILNGFNMYGFDMHEFDMYGFDMYGFDMCGFDIYEFDMYGFDMYGFNMYGFDMHEFDMYGFDMYGFDMYGFDIYGFDMYGFDILP